MKKKIFLLVVAIAILFSISTIAFAASSVSVTLDGKQIQFSDEYGYPFIDENNRAQVPLRIVMETYGCNVTWDAANQSAIISKEEKTVIVPIGKNYILVNGQVVPIDTAAIIQDNHTYLPIRAVLEAFDANVEWDATSNTVIITSPATAMQFDNIYIDSNGDLIVRLLDGSEKNLGTVKGKDGQDGYNGTSVIDAYINTSGELIIALSNGRIINAGTLNQTGKTITFDDYEVGTKFYMTSPAGEFDVTIYVDGNPYIVSFDSIYYELTAKNDYTDPDAWYYNGATTVYLPYQVTMYISGTTDPSLANKVLDILITNTQSRYGYSTTIQNDGTFSIEYTQGNGVDNINTWYSPRPLYFCQIICWDGLF